MTTAVESRLPGRTEDQRMNALARANEIRMARAAMKRTLTLEKALELVAGPPWWLESMKVEQFLKAIPRVGAKKARVVMLRVNIAAAKNVGGLSDRQRRELIHAL